MRVRRCLSPACALFVIFASCTARAPAPSHPTFPSLWTAPAPENRGELPAPLARDQEFRRGFVVGPVIAPEDGKEEDFKRDYQTLLSRARDFGATDLQLIVRWRQATATATEVFPFDSVHDELLTWLIKEAKRQKLRVLLAPTLAVGDGEAVETARDIAPKEWDAWWWSYRRFALHYARFAGYRRVELLSIGADLAHTEAQAERWRKLIGEIRKVYSGQLTYVARSERLEQVSFWSALDVASLEVQQQNLGSEKRQRESLAPLQERLEKLAAHGNSGFLLVDGGCGAPALAQDDCQRALYQSFRDDQRLRGVYLRTPAETQAERPLSESSTVVARHWFQKSKTW